MFIINKRTLLLGPTGTKGWHCYRSMRPPSLASVVSRMPLSRKLFWASAAAAYACLLLTSLVARGRSSILIHPPSSSVLIGMCGGGNFPCEIQVTSPPASLPPPMSPNHDNSESWLSDPSWLSNFFNDDEFYEQSPFSANDSESSFVTKGGLGGDPKEQPFYRNNRFWPLSSAWIPRELKQTGVREGGYSVQAKQVELLLLHRRA